MFSDLNKENLEETQDVLGGGRQLLDTGIYTGEIKNAYADVSAKGARFIALELDFNGQRYSENVYITNQQGKNFWERDGKQFPLPGFTTIDDLCLVTDGAPLTEQETQDKKIEVWDRESSGMVVRSKPVLINLIGQTASFAIHYVRKNKNVLNESTGKWDSTNEEQMENTINKVFHTESKSTVKEARDGHEALFWDKWDTKNTGNVIDRFKEVKGGATAGRPQAAGAAAPTERKSLFAKK